MTVKKCVAVFCLISTSIAIYKQLTTASVLLDNHWTSENKRDIDHFETKESVVGSDYLSSTAGLGGSFLDQVSTDLI